MKNRILNILIISIEIVLILLVFVVKIPLECLFQRYFNITCPACGMGRAFFSIQRLELLKAFKYNILSIPLAIFLSVFSIGIVIDIFKNTDTTLKKTEKFFKKYYLVILFLIIVSYIYNLLKNI